MINENTNLVVLDIPSNINTPSSIQSKPPLITIKQIKERTTQHPVSNLIYRQSMINDIISCPKRAAYCWIHERASNIDEYGEPRTPMMAALLGTAGHKVIEVMHKDDRMDMDYLAIMDLFQQSFHEEILNYSLTPEPSAGFNSLQEELDSKTSDYTEYLEGYQQYHKKLKTKLIISMHEQPFVLLTRYKNKFYIFSGTIDQAGAYEDGKYVMRDLKFRDNAFKPNYVELQFSPQLMIYSAALKYGYPACQKCLPKYEEGIDTQTFSLNRFVTYSGPCESCKAKIKTPEFPLRYPTQAELVWMKDFHILKRAYRGKKRGEFKGKAIYKTFFPMSRIENYLSDILEWCYQFDNGFHPRKPSSSCLIFCIYKNQCLTELRLADANNETGTPIIDSLTGQEINDVNPF